MRRHKNYKSWMYLLICIIMNQVNLLNLEKEYRTATHSSLVISNGKWIWFSQGKGGVSAISYLMDVKGMNYYEAVKYVDKCIRDSPPVYHVNKCSKRTMVFSNCHPFQKIIKNDVLSKIKEKLIKKLFNFIIKRE